MEFALIEAIRARTARARGDVALGIGDDAALLEVPAGRQLVACTDTLVAGVHFPVATAPDDIGWKALAVNLSDLAAMAAEPRWALLALTLPRDDPAFVDAFVDGFVALARAHGVALVGGDTTEGPLSVTVTALGTLPPGAALRRDGAQVGDALFVTGTLGDAAGALSEIRERGLGKREVPPHPLPSPPSPLALSRRRERGSDRRAARDGLLIQAGDRDNTIAALLARLNRPEPRVASGLALRGVASACIDVSDGLLADLGHVCDASGVGAEVNADALPISAALSAMFDVAACRTFALCGGDDYELCFSAPAARAPAIAKALADGGCAATRIGRIVAGSGIRVVDGDGQVIATPRAGWEHFSR